MNLEYAGAWDPTQWFTYLPCIKSDPPPTDVTMIKKYST